MEATAQLFSVSTSMNSVLMETFLAYWISTRVPAEFRTGLVGLSSGPLHGEQPA
jgi:hypothetical protein